MIVTSFLTSLIQNIAILVSVVLLYDYIWIRDAKPRTLYEKLLAGVLVGLIAILIMSTPWRLQEGVIFDVRTVLLSVAGLFMGAIPALVALIIAAVYRVMIGGPGVYMGVVTILCSGVVGILWKRFRPRWWKRNRIFELLGMGYLVHLFMLASVLFLPDDNAYSTLNIVIPCLTIYPLATLMLGLLMDGRIQNWKNRTKRVELENLYMSLIEQVPAGLFRKDKEGRFVLVNRLFCELKGLSHEEIVGKFPDELVVYEKQKELEGGYKTPPVQRTLIFQGEEHHRQIMRTGIPITVVEQYPQPDGSIRTFRVVKTPIFDSNGRTIGSQGMQFDITVAQKLEDALMQEQYLLNTFLDNSNDCIFFKDSNGCFLRVNKTQLLYLGANSESDVIGKSDFDFFTRIHAMKSQEDEAIIMQTGEPIHNLEERVTWMDNRQVWMITSKFPYRDQDGKIIGTFGVSKDISPQKQLENDLLTALNKVEESDRLKSAFLHNISHEIRTPMNSIIGFSGLLKDPTIENERKDYLADIVINSGNQLLSIIDDIVRIATVEAGQEQLNQNVFNLNHILSIQYDTFKRKAQELNLEFSLSLGLEDKRSNIQTDQTKFVQTINNLLVNAFKFTKSGYVHFGYTLKGEFLEFYVEDTGIGIPMDKQEVIFKRFSQVDNLMTRQFGGSGLGLSICKAYVELMGGEIRVESVDNGGSRFVFTHPYVFAEEQMPIEQDFVSVSKKRIASNKSQSLLVVDDEEMNFFLLREMLRPYKMRVLHAKNGLEALRTFRDNPDVVLVFMDLKMPVMDGYEASLQLQALKPELPIIAVTAYSLESDRAKALECGCAAVIVKPLDRKVLYDIVERFMPK